MRQSAASSRASHIPSQPPSAAALARLLEKKKELEAVSALARASALFLKRIEGLAEDCETMADAGHVHGQVLAQWPQMFRTLSMFLNARDVPEGTEADDPSSLPIGERLVRVPLEELQTTE
ncbi:hypothetical protein BV25DRAFT_1791349 [Artomyces pyxidatus]|uniref:Uncharacterized protein n=1 Tax=Artomyces pyxidatus TaxID=48021 RepID=A0ACB8TKA1_9AGAM|nr:hypothetical protein BV25DRAFT_1791349 [Artomyces pyxidatus]